MIYRRIQSTHQISTLIRFLRKKENHNKRVYKHCLFVINVLRISTGPKIELTQTRDCPTGGCYVYVSKNLCISVFVT